MASFLYPVSVLAQSMVANCLVHYIQQKVHPEKSLVIQQEQPDLLVV